MRPIIRLAALALIFDLSSAFLFSSHDTPYCYELDLENCFRNAFVRTVSPLSGILAGGRGYRIAMTVVDSSFRSLFTREMKEEEAPFIFMYVFLSTTALIMLVYFCSLIIFHCVFWPKILAKIKADKPVQKAKQDQILRELSVGRDKPTEDKTQSERSESPQVEHTPASEKDFFRAAHTVVSENASLIGDKTHRSARSARSAITCAATVTAAPAASPQLGVETAKENRAKPRRWYEDDMMTTGMELTQSTVPRKSQESKDHRKGKKSPEDQRKSKESTEHRKGKKSPEDNRKSRESTDHRKGKKRSEDMRTGREEREYHLRTGREKKEGGRTIKRLRFASQLHVDDTRTCLETRPLLPKSHSSEERKSDEAPLVLKRSEDARKKRKKMVDLPPASFYLDVDPTQKEIRGTERKRSKDPTAGTATRTAQSTDNRSTDRPEPRPLLECKTQED